MPATRVCLLVDEGPEWLWARLADFPGWRDWLTKVKDSDMAPGPTHSPGARRVVGPPENPRVHEVLIAVDAAARTMSYTVAPEPVWSVPARNYVATVRLVPLTVRINGRSATTVEWSSRYDCDQAENQRLDELFTGFYTEFIGNLASA